MFNVIYITYNNPDEIINMHLNIWKQIPLDIRRQINFILVDDCSTKPVNPKIDFPINLTIPRVIDDLYWNPPGAKNLGFMLADNDWTFTCDIDHTVPPEDYVRMFNMKKERKHMYLFERFLPDGSSRNKNSTNLFVMHREDFWMTGGYDEDFVGAHGFDDHLFIGPPRVSTQTSLIRRLGYKIVQTDLRITEHKRFETGDVVKKTNSNGINHAKLNKKLAELNANNYIHGTILRFRWKINKIYRIY